MGGDIEQGNQSNGNYKSMEKANVSFENGKPYASRMKILRKRTTERVMSKLKKFVQHRASSERNVKKLEKISERKTIAVNYDSSDHMAVITQLHGSILPKVIPCCILNCLLTFLVFAMQQNANNPDNDSLLRFLPAVDLTFSDQGHTFMSVMVSFLVVTRITIAYNRFIEARNFLDKAMISCREFIQHSICFTRYDHSKGAQDWRAELARRSIVLLRTLVCILEYPSKQEDVLNAAAKATAHNYDENSASTTDLQFSSDEVHALLISVGGSNERTPMVLTIFLRTVIATHRDYLEKPIDPPKELRLYQLVSEFVTAHHGLQKLANTPFPFPLVQMTRTFLFLWVFTLPMALGNDMNKCIPLLFIMFVITYGFIGLEYVAIELDDPFGDDPNDFDVRGLSEVVFDDIYIAIHDIDGEDAADALRQNVRMPLNKLTQNAVKSHKRFTSVGAWKAGGNVDKMYNIYDKGETTKLTKSSKSKLSPIPSQTASGHLLQSKVHEPKPFSLGEVFENISTRTLNSAFSATGDESHPLISKDKGT